MATPHYTRRTTTLNGFFIPVIIFAGLVLGRERGQDVGNTVGSAIGWTVGATADATRFVADWLWNDHEPVEGVPATNPETGERLVLHNGRWEAAAVRTPQPRYHQH